MKNDKSEKSFFQKNKYNLLHKTSILFMGLSVLVSLCVVIVALVTAFISGKEDMERVLYIGFGLPFTIPMIIAMITTVLDIELRKKDKND